MFSLVLSGLPWIILAVSLAVVIRVAGRCSWSKIDPALIMVIMAAGFVAIFTSFGLVRDVARVQVNWVLNQYAWAFLTSLVLLLAIPTAVMVRQWLDQLNNEWQGTD